jgi:hypothetical protein
VRSSSRVIATRTRPRSASRSRSSRAKASVNCFSTIWPETPGAPGSVPPWPGSMRTIGRPGALASVTCTSPTASRTATVRPPRRASPTRAPSSPPLRPGRVTNSKASAPAASASNTASPSFLRLSHPSSMAALSAAARRYRKTVSEWRNKRACTCCGGGTPVLTGPCPRDLSRRAAVSATGRGDTRLKLHDTTGRLPTRA